ncbi:conjugal transfer mating pair stabilization protein TraN [Legionella massiliensis]|uniref:Conjugal transfer mating pair stabilization protein TraN n=1 Tax=Legionella massiliensis TaxID=1034943 RepID=A0A078L5S1_9GAMM|nr:conjugal transfer protein TraN [Legionella massiliensis]CDZ79409.1 conjugal transfer mating pair stabilization protein TraN [Legionella massiliensis]CEE15147.1 conjugal transfer mating pair stabilization protein TraN [Legionella massiliensis]
MTRGLLFLLCCQLISLAMAQTQSDALNARNAALNALKGFNPSNVFSEYTANPKESAFKPTTNNNSLSILGLNGLATNPTAKELYQQAQTRPKIQPNTNSIENRYAETLLDEADRVLDGGCYVQKGGCTINSVTERCDEALQYQANECQVRREVSIVQDVQQGIRVINAAKHQQQVSFDLATCGQDEFFCFTDNLMVLKPICETVDVVVTQLGFPLRLIKAPNCQELTITVELRGFSPFYYPLTITLTERFSKDVDAGEDCTHFQDRMASQHCLLSESTDCLNPNGIEMIDGLAIKRACWGRFSRYHCPQVVSTNCSAFINKGCTQTGSLCLSQETNRCERYAQTFQCLEQTCLPEQTICPEKPFCAAGDCVSTNNETSDDFQEGFTRLGALTGAASGIAESQVQPGEPKLFSGQNLQCRIAALHVGNCCKDKGRLLHCRPEEKQLAVAIEEGRAKKVGRYCAHKAAGLCAEEKESWCVFSSKLASIIQVQGRFGQLHLDFGSAKGTHNRANCRGITPEELEQIQFDTLDLTALMAELSQRLVLPKVDTITQSTQEKAEALYLQGEANG